MDLETHVRRFEQQLAAFEKLHANELKTLEEKLAAHRRLQADEVKFLREELAALKQRVEGHLAGPVSPDARVSGQERGPDQEMHHPREETGLSTTPG